jgi:hypothetical protein
VVELASIHDRKSRECEQKLSRVDATGPIKGESEKKS